MNILTTLTFTELIVILNRLRHCKNYSCLFELETALAVAVDSASSLMPSSIIRHPSCPSVLHSDFDNFDVFVNDLYGAGRVHRTHEIMLQEFNPDQGGNIGGTASCEEHKNRADITEVSAQASSSRLLHGKTAVRKQRVPGWGGYVSLTGDVPVQLTTIEYFSIIPHPITDTKIIQECLKYSQEASRDIGQHFVVTFDLGLCMKAFPLVWSNTRRYEDHIIMIGTFHLACGYLKMLEKKIGGTDSLKSYLKLVLRHLGL
uniref:Uncharacterized protein n=1 Tax=Octopus bimaculoides TaxID=37653 RepID=A0A0L8FVT9_OCTBM